MQDAIERFFIAQMAMYTSYHRDARNRATHFVGVPLIIVSLMVVMALWRFPLGGVEVSFGVLFSAVVFVMWLVFDRLLGVTLVAILAPTLFGIERLALTLDTSQMVALFAATFVLGWIIQLWGHYYEGRRPALVTNLFQIFIAPMFLAAEVYEAFGLGHERRDAVEALLESS